MKHYPVIIIGGGASGLFLSSLLKDSLLLEKNHECGKKLLVTGGGACNITHNEAPRDLVCHYYEKKNFVSTALYSLSPEAIQNYFLSLNVETYIREDGKVFPNTNDAHTVRDALLNGGKILTDYTVNSVRKDKDIFVVNEQYSSNNLVIATGGTVFPQTGSTGDGYRFLKEFGHTIVPPRNALCEIKLNEDTSFLEGISVDNATLKIGKNTSTGPLLFTRKGLSGPVALNLSRFIDGETELVLKLCDITAEEIKSQNGKLKCSNALHQLTGVPQRLIEGVIPARDKNVASLTKEDIRVIIERLTAWHLKGNTHGQSKLAMVTCGGVSTKEVDSKSMESKLCPGLFIVGECLDVDGETGGYNLSFAFASSYLVYKKLKTDLS
ncbi:MAG: NAD(P)/FAD-dependent oxidoreductase [Sphaerochaetaceae bacterium]|nr:NAD(P)/FAD-dependent oxidoreductase [Sphaerochaetaceae bacterium]